MPSKFTELMNSLDYQFKDVDILEQAVTYCNPHSDDIQRIRYERLELLGSTVLQMVFTEHLFKTMHDVREGTLNIEKSDLLCLETQNGIVDDLQLKKYNQGPCAETSGSRYDKYVEAIIGAVYADAGFGQRGLGKAKSVIFKLWKIKEPPKPKCKVM